jgi:hypothetical protein
MLTTSKHPESQMAWYIVETCLVVENFSLERWWGLPADLIRHARNPSQNVALNRFLL